MYPTLVLRHVLPLLLILCASQPAAGRPLRVVVAVSDLGAIAHEILGPNATITVLAKATQDPHFVDARPSLILDLNRADAICVMGLDYEVGWLPVLLQGARNAALQKGAPGYIDTSTMITPLDVPRGPIDRSMGDIHPGGNPHFTLDPRNGVRIARGLALRFAAIDPAGKATYQKNAEAFAHRLEGKIADWERLLAPFRGAPVVTYHRSFVYLLTWLGLVETATIEPKPGIPPNPAYVAQLIQHMRAQHVRIILQERWYPSSTAALIGQSAGGKVVLVDGMSTGDSYIDHIDQLVHAMASGLS